MNLAGAGFGAAQALTAEQERKLREFQVKQNAEIARGELARRVTEDANQQQTQMRTLNLAELKRTDDLAADATDRNVGMDAANVMGMPGMTPEAKASELQQSVLRNPTARSGPAMLKMIESLTRIPEKPKSVQYTYTDPKTGVKSLRFADPTTVGAAGLDMGNEPQKPSAPSLTPEGLAFITRWAEQTGSLPPMGMAGGARIEALNNLGKTSPGLNIGETQADFAAGKQSLGSLTKMYDAVSAFEQTANKNLDVMLKVAQPIIDSGSPWLNKPLREWDAKALGGTELAAFNAARTVVIPEFARIISNPNLTGVLTNEQRAEVEKIMSGDATLPQMIAVSKVLQTDARNRVSSLQTQMGTRRSSLPGGEPASQAGGDFSVTAPNGKTYTFKSAEELSAFKAKAKLP